MTRCTRWFDVDKVGLSGPEPAIGEPQAALRFLASLVAAGAEAKAGALVGRWCAVREDEHRTTAIHQDSIGVLTYFPKAAFYRLALVRSS